MDGNSTLASVIESYGVKRVSQWCLRANRYYVPRGKNDRACLKGDEEEYGDGDERSEESSR